MSWHLKTLNNKVFVIDESTGKAVGKPYDTRAAALLFMRGMYLHDANLIAAGLTAIATEDPQETLPQTDPVLPTVDPVQSAEMGTQRTAPWSGVLTVEGIESGDGRLFAANGLVWDTTPSDGLPLMWQKETSHGGNGDKSVRVGNITHVWREPDSSGRTGVNLIKGRGLFDLQNPDGAEAYRRMKDGFMSGNSVDVDSIKDANVEFVYANPAEEKSPEAPGGGLMEMFSKPNMTIYHGGRIRGTTLVEYPAFTEARLSLNDVPVPTVEPTSVVSNPSAAMVAAATLPEETAWEVVQDREDALVAASHTLTLQDLPPREWFQRPTDVTSHGALTITDQGRVYGYLAPANVRHRSFSDRAVYAPTKQVDYSRFMGAETIVADGGRVLTGPITMGCGHASTSSRLTPDQAMEHYDNSCSILANVAVGEDVNGVWIAGALLPDVSATQVQRAMSCRLSGDWRGHLDRPGWRELTAALLVPVPGFPQARVAPSVRFTAGQLVSSTVPVRFVHDDAEIPSSQYALVAGGGMCTPSEMYKKKAKTLSARIGRDVESRLAKLAYQRAFRDFSEEQRKEFAKSGIALSDGSYPIPDVDALKRAIQAYGRSNTEDRDKVRRHIIMRARALNAANLIPDSWKVSATVDNRLIALQSRIVSN